MKNFILALLLFPATAFAADCEHSQPRDLTLDLKGVELVVFELDSHKLTLEAAPNSAAAIQGRACASDNDEFEDLTLTQHRVGNTLVVQAADDDGLTFNIDWFGKSYYEYISLTATLPDTMPVRVEVGSGDATISGVRTLKARVGSGDLIASAIAGPVTLSVGSGDAVVDDVGRLRIGSIGSGDVSVSAVRGPLQVGSIGSGDFDLSGSEGDVEIGSIGSGDAVLHDVSGSIRIGSVGSGDIDARNVGGDLVVRSVGSGDVEHSGVTGTVDLPPED